MKKKVISAILAGACALSALSFSATAAGNTDKTVTAAGSVTLKAAASVATPAIEVTVPSKIAAVVNPYGVAVKVGTEDYGATGIASGMYVIKNYTPDQTISVKVSGTVVVPTDKKKEGNPTTIKVLTASPTLDTANGNVIKGATEKSMFAYIIGKAGTAPVEDGKDVTAEDLNKLLTPAIIAKYDAKTCAMFADATKATKDAPVTGTEVEIAKIKPGIKAEGTTKKQYNYAVFTIAGSVSDSTVDQWTSADKINMNVVLNIGISA